MKGWVPKCSVCPSKRREIVGGVPTPVAVTHFAKFYAAASCLQGFDAKLVIATGAHRARTVEISPSQKPPFGNPAIGADGETVQKGVFRVSVSLPP